MSKQSESEAVIGGARGKSEVCQVADGGRRGGRGRRKRSSRLSVSVPDRGPRFETGESGERASRAEEAPAVGVSRVLAIVQQKSEVEAKPCEGVQFVK